MRHLRNRHIFLALLIRAGNATAEYPSDRESISIPTNDSLTTRFYIVTFLLVFLVMIAVGGAAGGLFLASLDRAQVGETVPVETLHKTLTEGALFLGFYIFVFMISVIVFCT